METKSSKTSTGTLQSMPLPSPEGMKGRFRYVLLSFLLILLLGGGGYLITSWNNATENPSDQNPDVSPTLEPTPEPQVSIAITPYATIPADFIQNLPTPHTITLNDIILTQSYGVIEEITSTELVVLTLINRPSTYDRISVVFKGETRWATADFAYSEGAFVHLAKEYIKYDDFVSRVNIGEYVRILYDSEIDANILQEVVLLQD